MSTKYKINPLTMNLDMVSDGESWAVKQKLNPLTWNFDMVGEWEVKMKLNPLTSNFDMVSEWGWGGWWRLPDAYQEVEYIESDVENWYGQVIDTWIYSSETISAEIKFKYNSNYSWDDRWIFWAYWTSWSLLLTHLYDNIRWHNYGNYGDFFNDNYQIHIIKTTPNSITIDWIEDSISSGWSSEEEADHTICIFTTHRRSYEGGWYILENCWTYKLFYFKLWDWDTLVRDLVPCYRKADNVIWMYDLVWNTFYTNLGTGNFKKWRDIVWRPWANTLLYCPLNSTDTYTDQSWNNVQTTSSWVSFWTYTSANVDCAYFNNNGSHKILIPTIAWSYPNITMSIWSYMTNQAWVTQIFMIEWSNTNLSLQPSSNWELQSQTYDGSDHYVTDGSGMNAWHHQVVVWNNWTSYLYVDGQFIWSDNTSSIINMLISEGAMWWHAANNNSIFAYWWYLSNAILESKTRTAQEVSDYFNQTKSLYGIS